MGQEFVVAAAPERDAGYSHRKLSATSPSAAATASVATIAAVAVTRVGSVPEEDEGHTGGAAVARPVAADAAAVATSDKGVIATSDKGRSVGGGFAKCWFSSEQDVQKLLDELKVTIRCIPLDAPQGPGTCFLTGKPASAQAIFAKAY